MASTMVLTVTHSHLGPGIVAGVPKIGCECSVEVGRHRDGFAQFQRQRIVRLHVVRPFFVFRLSQTPRFTVEPGAKGKALSYVSLSNSSSKSTEFPINGWALVSHCREGFLSSPSLRF